MRRSILQILSVAGTLSALCISIAAQKAPSSSDHQIVIQSDGTVEAPARAVPPSIFLTPEAKAYLSEHLHQMQMPMGSGQQPDNGVPGFLKRYLDRDKEKFPVIQTDEKIAGIHVYVFVPKAGVTPKNKNRVLINLHGGGFSGCWPGCAELESIPISALMGVKVISVDYREAPDYKFPAASEDVAKVYQDLLKTYKPKSIGIYGCSAGGMQTSMSLAWFQTHGLPTPGAAGIFCAPAGPFGGDANYIAFPLGEARISSATPSHSQLQYFSTANVNDPLVVPTNSPEMLAKFPPTLLITATRDFALSGALYSDIQLTKAGVDSELHVWDGLFHGFFYDSDIPESKEAFNIMVKFFDAHLATR